MPDSPIGHEPLAIEESDDEDINELPIDLKNAIEISKVVSNEGEIFEIADREPLSQEIAQNNNSRYYNELFACEDVGARCIEESDDDDDDKGEQFENMALKMEDISGDGGVLKKMISSGVGGDIPNGAQITYHYSAFLEYADSPFDSSLFHKKPKKCTLNSGYMIPGLQIGLQTMRKKEKAHFLIKHTYAFGKLGCAPRIPSCATILFWVHVLDFEDFSAANSFEEMDDEERENLTFSHKFHAAKDYHKKANAFYKQQDYYKAKKYYFKALHLMEFCRIKDEEESDQQRLLMFQMHSNLAQVFLALKIPARACTECQRAIDLGFKVPDSTETKLLFRYAKAKLQLDEFKMARVFLDKAYRLKPNNSDISDLFKTLAIKELKHKEDQKILCQKMFQAYRNEEEMPDNKEGWSNSNIQPGFKEMVKSTIDTFCQSEDALETVLPPDWSAEQMEYVSAEAKARGLIPEKLHKGNRVQLKLKKDCF